jgi:protein SCO1
LLVRLALLAQSGYLPRMNIRADRLANSQMYGSEIVTARNSREPVGFSRRLLALVAAGGPILFAGPAIAANWHNIDVSGDVPSLAFTMTDADTGKPVTAADFRGKLVMLYLGYTMCPDVCPLTLQNVAAILKKLGTQANDVQILFVTVDPNRDTLPVLKHYTALFAPQIVGLRGTADQLARLARRYRLAYSVSPTTKTHPYEVTHSSAVYVFDRDGRPRLLVPSLATTSPDLDGTAEDLKRLLNTSKSGWIARLSRLF